VVFTHLIFSNETSSRENFEAPNTHDRIIWRWLFKKTL